jgi:tetratricopeptide (TPR) repeat protein
VVASFPLIAESSRALIAWPSHMVELSFLLFSALALHEAAFRRLPGAVLALFAALLCKEVAVVTALMLPWVPRLAGTTSTAPPAPPLAAARRGRQVAGRPGSRRGTAGGRLRWVLWVTVVTVVWGIAYLAVRRAHDLHLPHDLEIAPGTVGTSWLGRYRWALVNSFRASFSLPVVRSPWEPLAWGGLLAVLAAAVWRFAARPDSRGRLVPALPLVAAGLLWFAAAVAPLTVVYPFWMPHRSAVASLGLAVALAATLGAARPALLAALVGLRLALFAASPGPPARIAPLPPGSGAFLDFAKLARLQRLMVETGGLLQSRFPTLPPGARVGLLHPPIMTEYAFGGSRALQAWYRDTTLRWLRYEEFRTRPEMELAAVLLYQSDRTPQMMLVEPAAVRHYLLAQRRSQREHWGAALAHLAAADSLQGDTSARVFAGRVAGRRAFCWLGLGRAAQAEREARRALDLWPESSDARFVLASVLALSGRSPEAQAQLDTLLRLYPEDRSARLLQDSLRVWAAAGH